MFKDQFYRILCLHFYLTPVKFYQPENSQNICMFYKSSIFYFPSKSIYALKPIALVKLLAWNMFFLEINSALGCALSAAINHMTYSLKQVC